MGFTLKHFRWKLLVWVQVLAGLLMGKALHKPKPSPPRWFFWDNDNCWFCKFRRNQKGCGNCKILKELAAEQRKKKDKVDFQKKI